MRFCIFLIIWVACYSLPQFAGDWYDSYFHANQSLMSLITIIAAGKLCSGWWVPEFRAIASLHIVHNLGDALIDFPFDNYNAIQGFINGMELALLIGGPLITMLVATARGWLHGRDSDSDHSDRGHNMARGENAQ